MREVARALGLAVLVWFLMFFGALFTAVMIRAVTGNYYF